MLKYKLSIFDADDNELVTFESGVVKPILLRNDMKGDPQVTFGFVTKTINEWQQFMKENK